MKDFLSASAFFGAAVSICGYYLGLFLQKRFKKAIFNPMLIAVLFVAGMLLLLDIPYETYYASAKYISWWLTLATVCLAIPLYEQFEILKKNAFSLLLSVLAGTLASFFSVFLLSLLFRLDYAQYVTLLPKSVTSAIGLGLVEEYGGYGSIAVAVIIVSGIFGNMFAEGLLRLFRITMPLAKGLAIGTCSHAIGTAKALEMGEMEGAMSSLAIVVSGLLTVALMPVFVEIYPL